MKSELHIGPAGWSYPDWEGIVYPRPRPRDFDPLAYLASYFNLIEVNSTFYRIPSARMCQSWVNRVSFRPDFLFTVKAFQEMTHARLPAPQTTIDEFKRAIDPIARSGRLSAVLVQFPWSFRFSRESSDYVRTLQELLHPLRAAVEVRHGSWRAPSARRFFNDHGLTMCGIDQPRIGDSLDADTHCPGEAGAYFRLHGRNRSAWFDRRAGRDERYNYLYSPEELREWSQRVRRAEEAETRIHVVLNNHFEGQAVANALEMAAELTGARVKAPPALVDRLPRLRAIATVDPRPRRDDAQINLFEDQE